MIVRHLLIAATFASLSLSAVSGAAMPVPPKPGDKPVRDMIVEGDLVEVALDTDKGRIVLALDRGKAPITTANFLAYVDRGWFDGQPFYRAMKLGKGGLIQGGVRDGAKQLPAVAHESTIDTGLKNVAGSIALANRGAGTAHSDFFIMTQDVPYFDAKSDKPGFAVFGHVVQGMDVVNAILAAPTSPTKGEGVMKGQMLEPEVVIHRAVRVTP